VLILAIETSCEVCGIALTRDGELLSLRQRRHRMDVLARLAAEIDEMLRAQSLAVADLDGIAVSLGPGSFTGLRIGVATAKTLAYAGDKPVVGVPTLDVLAQGAANGGHAGLVVAVVHARPGEVYAACYRTGPTSPTSQTGPTGQMARISDYLVVPIDRLASICSWEAGPVLVCGPAAHQAAEGFRASGAEVACCVSASAWPNPWTLALTGERRLMRGESDDPVSLVPLYVRKPTPEVRLAERAADV